MILTGLKDRFWIIEVFVRDVVRPLPTLSFVERKDVWDQQFNCKKRCQTDVAYSWRWTCNLSGGLDGYLSGHGKSGTSFSWYYKMGKDVKFLHIPHVMLNTLLAKFVEATKNYSRSIIHRGADQAQQNGVLNLVEQLHRNHRIVIFLKNSWLCDHLQEIEPCN